MSRSNTLTHIHTQPCLKLNIILPPSIPPSSTHTRINSTTISTFPPCTTHLAALSILPNNLSSDNPSYTTHLQHHPTMLMYIPPYLTSLPPPKPFPNHKSPAHHLNPILPSQRTTPPPMIPVSNKPQRDCACSPPFHTLHPTPSTPKLGKTARKLRYQNRHSHPIA